MFHPLAIDRIRREIPDAKLIVLLRDPVERTISHYRHEVRRGNEELTLEEALDAEPIRLEGEERRIVAEAPHYNSFEHQMHSYVARSDYAGQIRRILAAFPRERVLILDSGSYFQDPARVYGRVTGFLGVPPWRPPRIPVANATKEQALPPAVRARLARRFEASNEALFELLGTRYPWRSP
jgi:hypothetical protein